MRIVSYFDAKNFFFYVFITPNMEVFSHDFKFTFKLQDVVLRSGAVKLNFFNPAVYMHNLTTVVFTSQNRSNNCIHTSKIAYLLTI